MHGVRLAIVRVPLRLEDMLALQDRASAVGGTGVFDLAHHLEILGAAVPSVPVAVVD